VRRLEQHGLRPAAVVAIALLVRISYHVYYGWGVCPSRPGPWRLACVPALPSIGTLYRRARALGPGPDPRALLGGLAVGHRVGDTGAVDVRVLAHVARPAGAPAERTSVGTAVVGTVAWLRCRASGAVRSQNLELAGNARPGRIEYRLMRESIVKDYRRGRLGRLEVATPNPNCCGSRRTSGGRQTPSAPSVSKNSSSTSCSPSSRPSPGGLPMTDLGSLSKATRKSSELACYLVEVCTGCSWITF